MRRATTAEGLPLHETTGTGHRYMLHRHRSILVQADGVCRQVTKDKAGRSLASEP